MHICYLESGYPHPHGGGGAGTYVQLIGRELVRCGHHVTVIASACPQCPVTALDEGVQVLRPALRGNLHWYMGRIPGLSVFALALRSLERGWYLYTSIERVHLQKPIDVLEVAEGGDWWHLIIGRIPVVAHLHGSRYTFLHQAGKPVGRSDWYHRRLELFAIGRAEWVASPSQAMLNVVEQEAGKKFRRTSVIPYPLDPTLLENRHVSAREPTDAKVVFFAARNDPVKGADVLLAAASLVRAAVPQAEFRFFGYQPSDNQPLPPCVTCTPFLPKAKLLRQLHQADICVIPSRWDNSPNTVYEAMAAGKAVVASQVGGIPELVADGETGLLVPAGDPIALAEAIVKLLSDEPLRRQMGEQGRNRIQHLARMEKNVRQRLHIYKQIVYPID